LLRTTVSGNNSSICAVVVLHISEIYFVKIKAEGGVVAGVKEGIELSLIELSFVHETCFVIVSVPGGINEILEVG